jgi:hypothetical protein
MPHIKRKSLYFFLNVFKKALNHFKEASIPQKMYSKSLEMFEKPSH